MEQIEQQSKEVVDLKNLSGGLELLVQLAEKGEINPWDIDILEVTDKYLAALDKSPRENLLNAGRAIFFASVLLRLKSDILLNISNETLLSSQQTENFFPEDELLFEQNGAYLDLSKLESFLVRSSLCKQQRKRKICLGDLIFALQQAEEEEERRALRAKLRADRAFKIVVPETPEDVLEIAHEEDIEEVVEKIEAVIQEYLTDEKPITLTFLTEILGDKLKIFLALLFLANSQKVVLQQEEMYSEVYIYRSGTVIADRVEESEEVKEKEQKKKTKAKKKSIIDRLKEKITKRGEKQPISKVIEVITNGQEVIDITTKELNESEVVENGNNNTT